MTVETALSTLDFSSLVRPGDTVSWGQASSEPTPLIRRLFEQRKSIGQFNAFIGATYSDALDCDCADYIRFSSYCGTGRNRALVKAGLLDILPSHYSQLPHLVSRGLLHIDVLLLQLSPSDIDGRFSFSLGHDYLEPMIDAARVVVAEVNDQAPWTFGSRYLTTRDIDVLVHTSRRPQEVVHPPAGEVDLAIARNVASLIDDGATLQIGLGALPEAVLSRLSDRRDLGIHTGSISDRVADLMEAGVITNEKKTIDRGISIAGIMFGSRRLFAFADKNPRLQFRPVVYTHCPDVLASIEQFVALNAAVEVDVTGQINAEVAGQTYVGGVGGAMDFLRGAHRSKGGLPIVALPSTHDRASRIVSTLHGPVSTPRSDAGIIVTEHGIADLRGQPLSQRIRRMIAIAHPDHRDALAQSASG